MIERIDLFQIPFYKKTCYTGSYLGMHYKIEHVKEEDNECLRATTWPGPYCYASTDDSKKTSADFAFTTEGIDEACVWLNEQYEAHTDIWSTVHM